jgi:hypothetical protein
MRTIACRSLNALAALLVAATPSVAGEWRTSDSLSFYTARMTDNVAADFANAVGDIEFLDIRLVGAVAAREWRRGGGPFSLGVEAQVMGHFGEVDHLELAVPLTIRWHLPTSAPVSAAFGLGLSYASKPPQVEIDRRGASQRLLVYWLLETEFGTGLERPAVFLRLHHRSDAYGLLETDTGSNAIGVGLRRRW